MKFIDLIFFGRPMLVIPVWTVYLHYYAFVNGSGYFVFWPPPPAIYVLIVLTLIFKGAYVFNQIFDIESDRINEKLFFLPRGIISIPLAWIYYSTLTLAGMAIVLLLFPQLIRPVLILIVMGVLYSVPGIRLKDNPVSGLVANAAAYGFVIPWMAGRMAPAGISAVNLVPYFLAIASGYILTTIPDYDGDMAAGKRTAAVILGPKNVLWLALLSLLTTIAASVWTRNWEMVSVATAALIGVVYLLISFRFRVLMFACKFPILFMTLWAGSHYLFYLLLLLLTIVLTRFYYKRRFGIEYPKLS